jgi:hypothetical protein
MKGSFQSPLDSAISRVVPQASGLRVFPEGREPGSRCPGSAQTGTDAAAAG